MDPAIVTAQLRIEQKEGHVFAELTYTNVGDRPALLVTWKAALGNKLEDNVFKIVDEQGLKVSWTGTLAKRAKPGPQDFVRLEAGARATTRLQLDGLYKLPTDRPHDYTVVYSAYHQYPDRPGFWELVSNEAHFHQ